MTFATGKQSLAGLGGGAPWCSLVQVGYLPFAANMTKALLSLALFLALVSSCFANDVIGKLRKSAEQGDTVAQLELGFAYATGNGVTKDPVEAVKWYRKSAEQGNIDAQYNLGVKYDNGEGVLKDPTEAVKWWRKSAEQEFATAQYNLGVMYATGEGVTKDPVEAAKWFKKAAELGLAQAQFYLGVRYANGEGLLKNSIEGLAWLNIAAMAGDERMIKWRGVLERRVGPEGTLAAQQRSEQILHDIEVAKRTTTAPDNNTR